MTSLFVFLGLATAPFLIKLLVGTLAVALIAAAGWIALSVITPILVMTAAALAALGTGIFYVVVVGFEKLKKAFRK